MRAGVLGPLLVFDDAGSEVSLPVRLRTLLAALLVHANRAVAVAELGEIVWDGAPPGEAVRTVRSYVVRLRRALGPVVGARVETRAPGYLCRLGEDELDVLRFEVLCRAAGGALRAGGWAEAADAAAGALELWRGVPLLDVPSEILREAFVPRLEQLRLQALEDRAEAELRLGRRELLVPGLRDLTAAYPLRERFHAQLMQALAGCGRRGEALQVYRDARQVLVEQLGVEPGPELRDLHGRVLAGEDVPPAARPLALTPAAPRQLPAAAGHFTGRSGELEVLTALGDRSGPAAGHGGTVVISAIDGMAGIGKTALAIHAAHRLADRFPDGQLFVNLHGHTKGYPPREPGGTLEWLMRALGVPAGQIPEDAEARAALYRQRLADTRTLIVLDNASDEAQVRPLLPGAPGCLVLITSRRRLKGLDDARTLSLDLLAPEDAVALLRAVAGADRVPADDPALANVARLCGHLPLALRIAGALLRHRAAWGLEQLAGLLHDQHRRIAALSDGERDLATVFDLSYSGLGERQQLLLCRLGLVSGPDIDAYSAAALLEEDPRAASGLLEDLVDHNLLIAHAPGRYRLHDLIRSHTHALAGRDPVQDRDAVDRLLHYYAHTAQSASVSIARYPRSAPVGPAPAHVPAVSTPEAARVWLRAERDNLEAASALARASALDGHVIALAAGLAEIVRADGPFARALELHQAAADTAARQGRTGAHAIALTDLGSVRRLIGDLPGARKALTRALEIYREIGHPHGEATALTNLGGLQRQTGDLPGADEALTRAVEIYREIGHRHGEAAALTDLGGVRRLIVDPRGAEEALNRALELCREMGHRNGEALALSELGRVRRLIGDLPGARKALTRALEIYREIGHRQGEANTLNELGGMRRLIGDLPGARKALTRALEIYRELGHLYGEAYALTELAGVRRQTGDMTGAAEALTRALEIYRATGNRGNEAWALNHHAATVAADGDVPRALTLYQQALDMNRELNKPDDEAVALEGLGECHLATGEAETGVSHLHQALEIYQRLGMAPDTERVRIRLADLAQA